MTSFAPYFAFFAYFAVSLTYFAYSFKSAKSSYYASFAKNNRRQADSEKSETSERTPQHLHAVSLASVRVSATNGDASKPTAHAINVSSARPWASGV